MESRGGRVARNEALFREVNERIKGVGEDAETLLLLCECGDLECREVVEMTPAEYEAVRAGSERFFLVSGHEDLTVDRVVDQAAGFLVVEKLDEGGDVARDLDPRS
jgi:hypothetical protein